MYSEEEKKTLMKELKEMESLKVDTEVKVKSCRMTLLTLSLKAMEINMI